MVRLDVVASMCVLTLELLRKRADQWCLAPELRCC